MTFRIGHVFALSLLLLLAAWGAYAVLKLWLPVQGRALPNIAFAAEALAISLVYSRKALQWREITFAAILFVLISVAALVLGLFLAETHLEIAMFIGSPVDLGYYPPGADAPFFAAAPIWAVSLYALCIIPLWLGQRLGAAMFGKGGIPGADF